MNKWTPFTEAVSGQPDALCFTFTLYKTHIFEEFPLNLALLLHFM